MIHSVDTVLTEPAPALFKGASPFRPPEPDADASDIPLIDLSNALSLGGPRTMEVVAQLRAAAMKSGFFYVRNHGVPASLVDAQFELTRRFFDLPDAAKAAVDMRLAPTTLRGYEELGAQTLDADAKPDMKESFLCGIEYEESHPYVQRGMHYYGRSQWPQQLPEMPAVCAAYIDAMLTLSVRLVQLLALSLGLPENHFDEMCRNPMAKLRMLRYPPHPADADDATFGAGEHTDWGAVTILAQDSHGGLEVQMPDGAWVAATPMAGTFVVNLGDMVPRWTNGRYHSNPHRVRNLYSGGLSRYSIPFFFDPDHEAVIEVLPDCVAAGEAPRYASCTAGEHLQEMFRLTYAKAASERAAS